MSAGWPIVLSGRLTSGVLQVNRHTLKQLLANRQDCEIEILIERKHATRSLQANRYYFGVVLKLISEHTGYDVNETHEAMKALFLPKELAFCDGNGVIQGEIVIGGSTRKMNVNEFYDYVERVRRFAAEQLGLNVPDPDPNWQDREQELV